VTAAGLRSATAAAPGRREVDAQVGLVIFLGATAMLFAALLLAYAILRAQAPLWPPAGAPAFPRGAAGANTLALLAATVALHRARRGTTTGARAGVLASLGLGSVFLLAQAALWRHLIALHLGPRDGLVGEIFLALSGFHALHVLAGLIALALTGGRRLRLMTLYWDFVLVVWIVVYVAVCWL
jgi:heme/copper-type cytochrome/quinol oxidase subunit 3